MSGYARVSPANSDIKLTWGLNDENKSEDDL
jgi:hypothetical protein